MNKKLIFGLCLSLSLVIAGCGEKEKEPGEKEKGKEKTEVVNVVTEVPYEPFEYEENGKLTGFDVEVMEAIGKELNWEIKWNKETFENVFAKVQDGTYDIGISSITINDERKEKNSFSVPYFKTYQLIVVKKNSELSSVQDLKGHTVAVQEKTTGHELIINELGATNEALYTYSDMEQAIDAFISGKVEAMVGDNAFVLDYLKKSGYEDYALIKDPKAEEEELGILLSKEDKEKVKKINQAIERIQENGVYDEIYNKYFGQK